MSISPLRQVLSAHLGQVLTPELAAQIEAATVPVATPIDLTQFAKSQRDGFTIQAERFSDIQSELHELHLIHWQETEKHRHGLAMNPDYDEFIARERRGTLLQFTVRNSDNVLVGNMRMYLGKSLHTQTLYASEDTLFILPEYRGGFLVMALMRYAEKCLLSLSVREIRGNSKLVNKSDVLMRRLGYSPVALEFVKFFPVKE